eukprot:Clim_evm109s109 gene=Clim_evmTU109s109
MQDQEDPIPSGSDGSSPASTSQTTPVGQLEWVPVTQSIIGKPASCRFADNKAVALISQDGFLAWINDSILALCPTARHLVLGKQTSFRNTLGGSIFTIENGKALLKKEMRLLAEIVPPLAEYTRQLPTEPQNLEKNAVFIRLPEVRDVILHWVFRFLEAETNRRGWDKAKESDSRTSSIMSANQQISDRDRPTSWTGDPLNVDHYMIMDQNHLCELASTAYYLDIKPLVNITSKAIAHQLSGGDPEILRSMYSMRAATNENATQPPPPPSLAAGSATQIAPPLTTDDPEHVPSTPIGERQLQATGMATHEDDDDCANCPYCKARAARQLPPPMEYMPPPIARDGTALPPYYEDDDEYEDYVEGDQYYSEDEGEEYYCDCSECADLHEQERQAYSHQQQMQQEMMYGPSDGITEEPCLCDACQARNEMVQQQGSHVIQPPITGGYVTPTFHGRSDHQQDLSQDAGPYPGAPGHHPEYHHGNHHHRKHLHHGHHAHHHGHHHPHHHYRGAHHHHSGMRHPRADGLPPDLAAPPPPTAPSQNNVKPRGSEFMRRRLRQKLLAMQRQGSDGSGHGDIGDTGSLDEQVTEADDERDVDDLLAFLDGKPAKQLSAGDNDMGQSGADDDETTSKAAKKRAKRQRKKQQLQELKQKELEKQQEREQLEREQQTKRKQQQPQQRGQESQTNGKKAEGNSKDESVGTKDNVLAPQKVVKPRLQATNIEWSMPMDRTKATLPAALAEKMKALPNLEDIEWAIDEDDLAHLDDPNTLAGRDVDDEVEEFRRRLEAASLSTF